jgi:hypothetical protein
MAHPIHTSAPFPALGGYGVHLLSLSTYFQADSNFLAQSNMAPESIPYISVLDKSSTQHENTEDLAVQNTFIRRCLALLAPKTTARLYAWKGFCVPISKKKIIKTGPYVHLAEAATMKSVAENTSIPMPKVYCSFVRKNRAYIVMERIQGDELPTAWQTLSEESRQKVFDQLKHILRDLRSVKPPSGT